MAAIAVSRLPNAGDHDDRQSGRLATTRSHSSTPLMPGMFRSVTTTSKSSAPIAISAAGAVAGGDDAVAAPGQPRLQEARHGVVVFDDEDALAHQLPRRQVDRERRSLIWPALDRNPAAVLAHHAIGDRRGPRPVPSPTPLVVKNGSNTCGNTSAAMPAPSSCTAIARSGARSARRRRAGAPRRRERAADSRPPDGMA